MSAFDKQSPRWLDPALRRLLLRRGRARAAPEVVDVCPPRAFCEAGLGSLERLTAEPAESQLFVTEQAEAVIPGRIRPRKSINQAHQHRCGSGRRVRSCI
jgi:hypothetical protein